VEELETTNEELEATNNELRERSAEVIELNQFQESIRSILAGREERGQIAEQAVNRRGRPVDCIVNVSSLIGNGETRGVILMMDATQRDGTDGVASVQVAAGQDGKAQDGRSQDGKSAADITSAGGGAAD
jgi:hypothetical protein